MSRPLTFTPEERPPPVGTVETLSPLVRRVRAGNGGPFTYTGTGTYIVGRDVVAVIDPGPDDPAHIAAILAAVPGERISHILITHTHRDHSPGARLLQAQTGALVAGAAPLVGLVGASGEEAFDDAYAPDAVLADGERVPGPGWTLEAVATPGHVSNHLCFALHEEKALFSGDHVMGWSTTVVAPPHGDMAAYRASLAKVMARDERLYYPTHGRPIVHPRRFVRALIGHRRLRERQILDVLSEGPASAATLVARLYTRTPAVLHGAALQTVRAHLIQLEQEGSVALGTENAYERKR